MQTLNAVDGYVDNNQVIVSENISEWQGKRVIVMVLDNLVSGHSVLDSEEEKQKRRLAAADELFGLWADHDNSVSVDDMVRKMRNTLYCER